MTLPIMSETSPSVYAKNAMEIGEAVKQFLIRAQEDMRIIFGVYACAKFLESSPSDAGACILPQVAPDEDPLIQITRTLMEAHCAEHCVPVLKVDSVEKVRAIMTSHVASDVSSNSSTNGTDFTCMVVRMPTEICNCDEYVLSFCDSILSNESYSCYLLELPI